MEKGFNSSSVPLIGVCLLGDGFSGLCDSNPSTSRGSESDRNGTMIGVIKCDDQNQSVNNFRLHLQAQLPLVPPKFRFLCKNGWPIEKNQEPGLTIQTLINSSIVKIQRNFDIPRFGVRWYEGDFLGFIFVDFNSNLSEVREAIGYQLKGKISAECPFEFRDKNGWPVIKNQEKELLIWDVCHHNYFNICKSESKLKNCLKDNSSSPKRPPKKCKLSKDSTETNTMSSGEKVEKMKTVDSASILISYVHGEASKHARDLKSELVNLGCKVFLDIDDIPSGCDWQDVINREVSSCVAFVALVTPSYGETRWTNREAKFADDKEKHIIPVSFLDKWPPDQLAIQFLSLQYIQWKTHEEIKLAEEMGESHRAKDIRYWDKGSVHRVAKEILKWLPSSGMSTPDGPSSSSHITYRMPPDSLSLDLLTPSHPDGFLGLPQSINEDEADIVISAHPKQKDFVENIKRVLEEADFKVWCSIDMIDTLSSSQDDMFSSDSQQSFVGPDHVSNTPATPNPQSEQSQDSSYAVKRPKFLFSYSVENGVHCSGYNFGRKEVCTPETPSTLVKLKQFKCKTEKAKLVILIVSEDYCASCMCKKQAFYCEHRKKVIAIKFGDFDLRCPLFSLYQEHDMLQGSNDSTFLVKLRDQVKEEVCRTFARRRKYEEKIQRLVTDVKKRITCEKCIYVIGGTRFISGRNEEICISLGTELAKLKWLSLATEGFFGVSEVVGRNFCEERVITNKGKPTTQRNKDRNCSVFHIIPHRDQKDFSKKARQEEDGAFEKIPFGETVYCGDSVSERDAVVTSLFKICILIEGGYRTARLAEKFMWNDCIIIPVMSTGGAASGKYSLPPRMLQVPCGVSESDWFKLQHPQETAEEISYAVKKIIKTLFKIRDIKL